MKTTLQSLSSFVLAILVLFSTMSFTVEKHFCGKSLVGHAVFSSVEKCKSEMSSCGIGGEGHEAMKKGSCCSDKTESIIGQDELNFYSFNFNFMPAVFILPISFLLVNLLPEVSPEIISYPPYEPPQLVYDLQILCQVFTI